MKGVSRIYLRYVCSAAGIVLLVLLLNALVMASWLILSYAGQEGRNPVPIRAISDGLHDGPGGYALESEAEALYRSACAWAMLLDDSGRVVWSDRLPEALPRRYSVGQVASFTRWYLMDYPTSVWSRADGLLVLGLPKGSLWKGFLQAPESIIRNAHLWVLLVVSLNVGLVVGLALLMGRRLHRELTPIAQGIESLARGDTAQLATGGLLGGLAACTNQVSENLARGRAELARRDDARANWIRSVSHDIRTPLSLIAGYAAQLAQRELPGEARGQAGIIQEQAMRIRDLISDLNLATRLEYDMQPLSLRPVSVPGLARAAVSELINAGLSERFEVEVEVAAGAQAVQVLGDERLLLRALHNLLGNSVRHNPAGCRIGVRVGCEGARAWIEVRDGGAGYPIKVLAAMARDDRSDHVMGLGIVRQIARAHGGEAQFENRPEGGCVARVMLPLTGR